MTAHEPGSTLQRLLMDGGILLQCSLQKPVRCLQRPMSKHAAVLQFWAQQLQVPCERGHQYTCLPVACSCLSSAELKTVGLYLHTPCHLGPAGQVCIKAKGLKHWHACTGAVTNAD